MTVGGQFHDQKHITIFLSRCIFVSTLFLRFLLHLYLHSLNTCFICCQYSFLFAFFMSYYIQFCFFYHLVASPMSLWLLWWPQTGSSMFMVVVMLLIYSVLHCLYSVGNKITTITTVQPGCAVLWCTQIIKYTVAWCSYSFVWTLHCLIIIIMQTYHYLKVLNF